jgi:uncharacterized Ntn-hydrolase superfamily protein
MTYSIVARDEQTGAFGVAGFTSIVGYGFLVPQASLRVDAAAAADQVVSHDFDRDKRQLLVVGESSRPLGWSGQDALAWCGHKLGRDHVAGGNTLVSEDVVIAMSEAYEANRGEEFGLRLIRAVQAGKRAGGERSDFDAAGVAYSSALLIAGPRPEFWHNLRVDATTEDASAELERLYDKAREEGALMQRLYEGTDVVIRPFHWRWVRDLTGRKDPPDA